MGWFWESSEGDEPVYLGYSWLKPGTGDNANPAASNSLDVWAVVVDSPLFKSGLTQGSGGLSTLRIEAIDGKAVSNAVELGAALADKVKGDEVSIAVNGGTYLVQLDNPPPIGTEAVFRFSEPIDDSMDAGQVLVEVAEAIIDVPADIITAVGDGASAVLGAGSEVVEAQAELFGEASKGILLVGVLAAGAYFVYNRELRR